MHVQKKELIITGGAQGIGKAIINSLNPNLWRIALLSKSRSRGKKVISEFSKKGCECKFYCVDLSELDKLETVLEKILVEFNNIYAVINNAGTGFPQKIENINSTIIENVFRVNLFSPMLIIKKVVPIMKKNKQGRIINISSVAGKKAITHLTAYSASKAGLISITQSLAKEMAETGITVNCICPACVDTRLAIKGRKMLADIAGANPKNYYKQMIKNTCLGRPILAVEVARVVKFLLEEKNSFITGQSINVCGAYEVI